MDIQLQKKIAEKLNENEIPNAGTGYAELIYAIGIKMENPRITMRKVHEQVAEKFGVKPLNSERSMRYAVQKNHPEKHLAEFISKMAIEMKLELGIELF